MKQKILVTGSRGLVGSNLQKIAPDYYYIHSGIADLRDQHAEETVMKATKPDVVIHLAARVGGITSNVSRQADYYYDNTMMNTNVVHEAMKVGCKRVIGLLSTCIYPDVVESYPMTEDVILNGKPSKTNYGYAMAKRGLMCQLETYNEQYGMKNSWIAPCNLYGIGDKYDESNSHFVAALIKKIHVAKTSGQKHISLFGDGTPLRQFVIASDLAKIIKMSIDKGITESFNFAPDENRSILDIASNALIACDASDLVCIFNINNFFNGRMGKMAMNGQMRKDADNSRMKKIFPNFKFTSLHDGIKEAYKSYSEDKK